jgi:hypothetical protein
MLPFFRQKTIKETYERMGEHRKISKTSFADLSKKL